MPSSSSQANNSKLAAFAIIKQTLLAKIASGKLKQGDTLPAETKLAERFGVSRMTVNRALRELTQEKVLIRVQGGGTYVNQQKYQTTPVEIKNIADEVRSRGGTYQAQLFVLKSVAANNWLADAFTLPSKSRLYYSEILHFENDQPIQLECRWVNPKLGKTYLQQDFTQHTPNEFLMQHAPLQGGEYSIEALLPSAQVAQHLHMTVGEACLLLTRKTYSHDMVASLAKLWHPGNHYRFIGRF